MAVEARRGCGYRKVGGLYIVSGKLGESCCKLPIPLHICPTCAQGVKQTRGWSWIDPQPWLAQPCIERRPWCPAARPELLGERVGLLWIGRQFYPTPGAFTHEAALHGVSRRITAIPRGFVLGEHWVFLAHPEAVVIEGEKRPGIFSIFKPTAFEKLVTETQSHDADLMADLAKRGIDAVVVPDTDQDHQGTVYDEADDQELPLTGQPDSNEGDRA
ncbi:hypothetical protein ACVMGC_001067 [Bradyrhizobium barranii subsp. barranii]|uniref:hypothetical protein n=1 Tax=Bradyrhizobium TaxID=374 RepID=UPI001BA55030|nr:MULTISPECIES: hypothetical protein [Bradyrhizobium]MBR0879665.1 hypothetical protein [Bradyrhizobium liaoningense]MCP1778780.1 hypothetical protein [Bradyrhizobium japonicum]MCP1958222.1 hypothetical protein [Bradyrhizobium japonicum]